MVGRDVKLGGGARGGKSSFAVQDRRMATAAAALGTVAVVEGFVEGEIEGKTYEFLGDVALELESTLDNMLSP